MDVAHLRQDFNEMRTQIVVEYYYSAPTYLLMFLYSITGSPINKQYILSCITWK